MRPLKLYMLLLGCSLPQRNTEQHDVFFGIGHALKDLVPDIYNFWPEAKKKIHIDAWREVTKVDNYKVDVVPDEKVEKATGMARLFFINLGGYKHEEFEEFHYKMLAAGIDKGAAVQQAKKTAFYRHTGFKGANSHIDDKFGIDVDDACEIKDILPAAFKEKYSIVLSEAAQPATDQLHLGYIILDKLK